VIRPTGLLDPLCEVRPVKSQVDDLLGEIKKIADGRVLVTTLTKKMAEQLTDFLTEHGIKAKYLHSDIETLERIELLRELRLGKFQVLVGINLLREGLDVPECELVAIMDADKEGFLRSARSLIQTIGRAARNADGRVILYADKITDGMRVALDETARRREKQAEYNKKHGIVPKTIVKSVFSEVSDKDEGQRTRDERLQFIYTKNGVHDRASLEKEIINMTKQMRKHAENLEFEQAGAIRDAIRKMEDDLLLISA
jgi:excinuclease ABC subunit B